jgi:hypothetical protein
MSGIVIGLVALLLLVVVGAVIYFAMQEEKAEPAIVAPVVPTVPTVDDDAEDEEEDTDSFDIVNGWIYDNEYNYMIKLKEDKSGLEYGSFNEEVPDQGAKWTFEPDDEDFYIVSGGKYLKISGDDVQVVGTKTSTAKLNIKAVDDGYKISDRKDNNWFKMDGANLVAVDDESKASVFSIEASQYYIKGYESENESSESTLRGSLTKHRVSCDNGVLSSFEFTKDGSGSKYRYDYECTQGGAASGELLEKTVLQEGGLSEFKDLTVKKSFGVSCEVGALANFRVLPGTGENASYEYTCRDIGVSGEPETVDTPFKDFTTESGESIVDDLANINALTCNDGSVLTGFNYVQDGENSKYKLSGICKKLSI